MAEITKRDVEKLCAEFAGGSRTTAVASDVWVAALESLVHHWDNPLLKNRALITLVDFRLKSTEERMWVFQIHPALTNLMASLVSHGKNSGRKDGPGEKDKMSNVAGSNQSSIGAFVTLDVYSSKAGKLGTTSDGDKKRGPALRIEGLEPGVNDKVKVRAIVFHGASYVTAKRAGRSEGCFATEPDINKEIIDLIKGGTFVYAYAG